MTILLIALIIAVIGSYLFFKGGYQISSGDQELINKIAAMDPVEHVYGVTGEVHISCLLYTSPSPRDLSTSRMPSSA